MRHGSARSHAIATCLTAVAVLAALAGCGDGGPSIAPASGAASQPVPSVAPSTDGVPSPPAAGDGQTDTDWGRIWDTLPAGFPRYPGSTPADDVGDDAASARDAIADGDAEGIASWFQTQLELATYSTEGLSGPFEDGGYVLDSVGDGGCRIQTTVAPMGSLIMVTIRYGADCPA